MLTTPKSTLFAGTAHVSCKVERTRDGINRLIMDEIRQCANIVATWPF